MSEESNDRVQKPSAAEEETTTLYAARKKLFVRSTTGYFANWRWILVWVTQIVFYGLPWLTWNGRQAVLFHLTERKFYLFGWVFWPQDVFYLALILIISAFALFFFTAVAGRLWCGYACPQTVYTEIFMWIEEKIEGDHTKRRKLDAAPMDARKFRIRATKYTIWVLLSLWTGFTFVAYFSPLEVLLEEILTFGFGPWELFWILFYGGFTFLFAGVLREQVCKYMCPYARFQGVMFDPDTLVITYDSERGEPRGARKKGVEPASVGKGDCIDCNICVQVCPTGIDIRDGLQYECIGCAACIDACDQVMERMNYPKGLIRYSTENALRKRWGRKEIIAHVARPRTLIYATLLTVVVAGLLTSLALRPNLRVDVSRDRAALAREVAGGEIENIFNLHIMNMVEQARTIEISVSGLEGLRVEGQNRITVPAATAQTLIVPVRVMPSAGKSGSHPIEFTFKAEGDEPITVNENSTFILPR